MTPLSPACLSVAPTSAVPPMRVSGERSVVTSAEMEFTPETQPTTPSLVTTGSFTATPALVPRSIVKV